MEVVRRRDRGAIGGQQHRPDRVRDLDRVHGLGGLRADSLGARGPGPIATRPHATSARVAPGRSTRFARAVSGSSDGVDAGGLATTIATGSRADTSPYESTGPRATGRRRFGHGTASTTATCQITASPTTLTTWRSTIGRDLRQTLAEEVEFAVTADEVGRRPLLAPLRRPAFPDHTPDAQRLRLPLTITGSTLRCRIGLGHCSIIGAESRAHPGGASDCILDAVFTTSPATASPICGPAPESYDGFPAVHRDPDRQAEVVPAQALDRRRGSPGRMDGSYGSSSWATGAPKTPITASPMNLSSVPP